MKEEGDWSSERRRPHGSIKFGGRSIIPEWASLPPELVERIADRVLSTTGGVDAYMDMRAVCSAWRSAIAKPSPLAAVADFRFRPRHWVMLDLKYQYSDDNARLFLHTPTGRFRRLRLPVLRDHILAGTSEGLLVLGLWEPPRPRFFRLLNPLTGDMLHFAAPLHEDFESIMYTAVSGGYHSMLVLWRDLLWRKSKVLCADPNSDMFTEHNIGTRLVSMVTFQGNIYCANPDGCVLKIVGPAEQCHDELLVKMSPDLDVCSEGEYRAQSYLVESDGQLLLVRHQNQTLKVFRVDVEHKCLEELKSLGGCHALFLGEERCVSVDAGKLPSVDADCIHMFKWVRTSEYTRHDMCVYNLRDDATEIISSKDYLDRPFNLVLVLLRYCGFR